MQARALVEHLAQAGDATRIARQPRELGVEEGDVEGRVVDHELGAVDEEQQLVDDLGEFRRRCELRMVDAVHRERARVDLALGIHIAM